MTKKAENQEASVLDQMKLVLSDTFVLYMRTYAVHWNYRGAKFFSVHKLTEEHYGEMAEAIDQIAERIRAKGDEAPVSLAEILQSADMNELKSFEAGSDRGVRGLIQGHELLAKRCHQAAEACEEAGDLYSHDMLVARIGAHEKACWMLKSFSPEATANNS